MAKRRFILGEEWLYYKIYTGPKTADYMMAHLLYPCLMNLVNSKLIDRWFFIRYSDPKYHIRLRLHLTDLNKIGEVINELQKTLKNSLENNLIWRLQTDTYNRELERYGNKTIELSEDVFFHDSKMISRFIIIHEQQTIERDRWLFAIKAIDQMLSDIGFQLSKKNDLMDSLQTNFGREFGMNKALKVQLDKKFRLERPYINKIMTGEKEYSYLFKLIRDKTHDTKEIFSDIGDRYKNDKLEVPFDHLISSYIHMLCNRLFRTKQRLQEFVVYYFLHKYYKSEIAKNKKMG